jgi:ElaB/YqjD/DUF883 family membrane-anchored ribosome-binding protein
MFPSTAKNDTVNDLKNTASDMQDGLNKAANQAGRKVRDMYDAASDELSTVSDKVTSEIRSNPVRSSMIALGVGALIGALLRR